MENSIETEQDLQQLIGQYESIRLDFKASALLAQPTDRTIKQLTEDVSAFTNTEGGVVVVGISEGKRGKKSIAVEIDEGVDPLQVSPEWLEQIIASNISPPIPGLTVRPIPLSGPKAGRVAYVVTVPKGTTAYQARHSLLYYGRTEFAATPLYDNVIRLLMTRGRVAQARVEVVDCNLLTAEDEWAQRVERVQAVEAEIQAEKETDEEGLPLAAMRHLKELEKRLEVPKRTFDEYSFRLNVVNSGEVTIRDFLLSISFETPLKVFHTGESSKPQRESLSNVEVQSGRELRYRFAGGQRIREDYLAPEKKIFPGDQDLFPNKSWIVHVPHGASIGADNLVLHWMIYLDNAPSSSGEINLFDYFRH